MKEMGKFTPKRMNCDVLKASPEKLVGEKILGEGTISSKNNKYHGRYDWLLCRSIMNFVA